MLHPFEPSAILLANAFIPLLLGGVLWDRAPHQIAIAASLGLCGFALGIGGALYGLPCWYGADVYAVLAVERIIHRAPHRHRVYPLVIVGLTLVLLLASG